MRIFLYIVFQNRFEAPDSSPELPINDVRKRMPKILAKYAEIKGYTHIN